MIILIGGTGSIARILLNGFSKNRQFLIFSRSEFEQFKLKQEFPNVKCVLGDIKYKPDLENLISKNDMVFDFAALKHVKNGEENPYEVSRVNILGTQNVIEVCQEKKARMIFMSSDKSVHPISAYGCTKLIGEKMVDRAGFQVIRSGNVIGSRGSIFDVIKDCKQNNKMFQLTDPRMERYFVKNKDLQFIFRGILSGVIRDDKIIPRMFKMKIVDLLDYYKCSYRIIGRQTGEKLKERLLWTNEKLVDKNGYYAIEKSG